MGESESTRRSFQRSSPPGTDLQVSEIFESLQGEGITLGTPSTFVRLAQCNLRCHWCDTKYTWDWEHYNYEKEVTVMSAQEIISSVRKKSPKNLVVTGGEPLLQQKQLTSILTQLKPEYTIETETAGTIVPGDSLLQSVDIWNVSPKLENSGNRLSARLRPVVLSQFASMRNSFFKFVIEEAQDLEEILSLVRRFSIPSGRVFLMPEATTREELDRKSTWLAPLCALHQFRLSYRLQVALWGNRRGY